MHDDKIHVSLRELMVDAHETFLKVWAEEGDDHGGYNKVTAELEHTAGYFYHAARAGLVVDELQ